MRKVTSETLERCKPAMRKVWPAREYRDHGRFILTDYDNGGGFEPFEVTEADWREYLDMEESIVRQDDWIMTEVYGSGRNGPINKRT